MVLSYAGIIRIRFEGFISGNEVSPPPADPDSGSPAS
jgi:hypothetical protein